MPDDARAGVDVGGTFTDVVTASDGEVAVRKTPSTPDRPDEGVTNGLEAAADAGLDLGALSFFGHGTTHATNAVLEGDWAETALLTTEGFRDVFEIGRQTRPDLYDLFAEKPTPIVPRERRHEVPERLDERGGVREPLSADAVRDLAADIDADSVAVCLLFAFENDAHERRVRELLREAGIDAPITLSSVAHPEIREYERTVTTALDAALRPVMERYIDRLAGWLQAQGVPAPLTVMASNGGLIAADDAAERPTTTLLSGPAAGVQGAAHAAERRGFGDLLTMDMGGTSCDVSLVTDGDPQITTDAAVGDYPVGSPAVDVHTVGSGGGSIARVDAGGALRVGPKSAGADPGPVCYGRGGAQPTTTDAHALLGRINPDRFLDGAADDAAVRAAVREHVADPLDATVTEAAQGILDVAAANLERALRVVSVERGRDPREFTLVAFGGAGPLHATRIAERLDVPRVLVPRHAGVLSAVGLLVSDVRYHHSTSRVRPWGEVDPDALTAAFEGLESRGNADLDDAGVPESQRSLARIVDVRYAGQSFSLSVPVPDGLDAAALSGVADRFHEAHERRYGHADPDADVESVTLRVRARGQTDAPNLAATDPGGTVAAARRETRRVGFEGDRIETPVYERERLPHGGSIEGPAIVEGGQTTCVVRPGHRAEIVDDGALLVEVDP